MTKERVLPGLRRSWPALAVVLPLIVLTLYVLPIRNRNPLWETTAWMIMMIVSFAGYGSLLKFAIARNERVDWGLRAAWGMGVVCALGGLLMVPAWMTRGTSIVVVQIGIVLAFASLVYERVDVARRVRLFAAVIKREPRLALVACIVAGLVALHVLGAICDWHTNPYDDDIAYLPFVKKLRDTGTLIEPFSFRRLSAYGGQTLFLELTSARAEPHQANTFDRGICFLVILLLLVGHRSTSRGRQRPSWLFLLATIAMLATLPTIAINTASYWSGVVLFLGLFRTIVWLRDKPASPWRGAVPFALLGAAACTLRQNFLPIPAVMFVTTYGFHIAKSTRPWRERLQEPALAGALTLAALVPWFIVSQQSSQTFLYPVIPGTFHRALELRAAGMNAIRETGFHVWVALEGVPLAPLGLFVLSAAFVKEREARRPLWSLTLGAAAGFLLLVHGLTQSDAGSIGRYAFGFVIAFVLGTALTTSTVRLGARLTRAHVAAGIALFAILIELVIAREKLWKTRYSLMFHNIEEAAHQADRSFDTIPPEYRLYERVQNAVPAGARLAILLDEPYWLDFKRNPIWNLDMPGYASLPPKMPFFQGSQKLADYFHTIGVRYLSFVRSDQSRYHYRREYWIEMLAHEQEIWRAFAPYLLDFLDNVADLAKKHRIVYEERGIVVLDLDEPVPPPAAPPP